MLYRPKTTFFSLTWFNFSKIFWNFTFILVFRKLSLVQGKNVEAKFIMFFYWSAHPDPHQNDTNLKLWNIAFHFHVYYLNFWYEKGLWYSAPFLLGQIGAGRLPPADQIPWLVSEEDAPQQLLPLPDSLPVDPDDFLKVHGNGIELLTDIFIFWS